MIRPFSLNDSKESWELGSSSDPDLVKVTEIFLVPSSFLVAALGTADTNPHRAAVSLVGLIVSVLWLISSREALADLSLSQENGNKVTQRRRTVLLPWLAVVFVAGWLASVVVHLILWAHPLGR